MKTRATLLLPCFVLLSPAIRAFDCDGDGVHDFDFNMQPIVDCDGNGWPEACDLVRQFPMAGAVFEAAGATSFLSADLDSDGDVDIVAGDGAGASYLLLNEGTGSFSKRAMSLGLWHGVFTGDMDEDGDTDLLVPGRGSVTAYMNEGLGVFVVGTKIVGHPALGLDDLDADGDLDVLGVKTEPPDRQMVAFLKEGSRFGDPKPAGPFVSISSVCIEDLDADGRNDVAVCTDFNVSILLNKGLPLAMAGEHELGGKPLVVLAADTDEDGDQDLVTVNVVPNVEPTNMSVLANEGNGTYSVPRNYLASMIPTHAQMQDMDGDGDPDLIGISRDQYGVTAVWNERENGFRTEVVWKAPFFVNVLDAVDLDGDRDLDIAVSLIPKRSGWIVVLNNLGNGKFQLPPFDVEDGGIQALSAGDFDGDGKADLASAGFEPARLTTLRNEEGLHVDETHALSQNPGDLSSSDLDADGDLDLAITLERLTFFSNDGGGHFEPILAETLPFGRHLAAADLDGDGLADLVTTAEDSIQIVGNLGGWRFQEAVDYPLGAFPESMVAAEVNGDGRIDLIASGRNAEGSLSLLLNRGDGTLVVSRLNDIVARHMDAADVDQDGDSDLVLEDSRQSAIAVLEGVGNGSFAEPRRIGSGSVSALALSDLNRDGDLDLATGLFEEPIALHFNAGDGSFPEVLRRPAGRVLDLVAADFDMDGNPDLALGRDQLGLLILHNAVEVSRRDCNANGMPDTCDIAGGVLLDVDGDGLADDCGSIPFTRADVDMSVEVNITDAVWILNWLFIGGFPPSCLSSADTDDNAAVDLADAIFLLRFLFLSGDPPPAPFPGCGRDPTLDDLGCRSAKTCPR